MEGTVLQKTIKQPSQMQGQSTAQHGKGLALGSPQGKSIAQFDMIANARSQMDRLVMMVDASPATVTQRMLVNAVRESAGMIAQRSAVEDIRNGSRLTSQQQKAAALQQKHRSQGKANWQSASSPAVQLAAAVNQVGGGNLLVNHRALNQTEYQRQVIADEHGTVLREEVSVYGVPGFGTNLGQINGNGNVEIRPSVQNIAHSEPILIGRSYGAIQANPNWAQANAAVDAVNLVAGGAATRNHFVLFSERAPCGGCGPQLANARYDNNDMVNWRYPLANGTYAITQSHIARATLQFGYHFAVDANRDWRLAGWRETPIQPSGKRKAHVEINKGGGSSAPTAKKPKGGISSDSGKTGSDTLLGSASNPIVVE